MDREEIERKPQLPWRKRDITDWNKWRERHPEASINLFRLDVFRLGFFQACLLRVALALYNGDPDRGDLFRENFKEADLRGANLRESDFRRADLRGANLSGAALNKSDLYLANFGEAILSGANLSGAALFDANLSGADLSRAKLDGADLRGANLRRANLSNLNLSTIGSSGASVSRGAVLSGANLSGANLSGANLRGLTLLRIDLSGADLSGADLSGADLRGVNLRSAKLNGARTLRTIFDDVDLRTVKGLETVQNEGPSIITASTLERSEGEIHDVFLRRAGLSETFITFVRSLKQSLPRYYTCFISCSGEDRKFAEKLIADLRSKGVQCWYAPEDLKIGDHFHQRIEESILLHDKLILILSEHAIQSSWVEREVVAAREKEDQLGHEVLFPIRLDDAVMHTTKAWARDVHRRWHIGDFTQWKHQHVYQQALECLLRDLKAEQRSKD